MSLVDTVHTRLKDGLDDGAIPREFADYLFLSEDTLRGAQLDRVALLLAFRVKQWSTSDFATLTPAEATQTVAAPLFHALAVTDPPPANPLFDELKAQYDDPACLFMALRLAANKLPPQKTSTSVVAAAWYNLCVPDSPRLEELWERLAVFESLEPKHRTVINATLVRVAWQSLAGAPPPDLVADAVLALLLLVYRKREPSFHDLAKTACYSLDAADSTDVRAAVVAFLASQ